MRVHFAILGLALALSGLSLGDGVVETQSGSGPTCAATAEGETCTTTSRKETGVEAGTAGVYVFEEDRASNGYHTCCSPNEWQSTSTTRGVRVAAPVTAEAGLTLRDYTASQEEDGRTRTTTEKTAALSIRASPLPDDPPEVSFVERRVEGGYHYCLVMVGSATLVGVPCGPEILEEDLVP